jgi:hypothetical protein
MLTNTLASSKSIADLQMPAFLVGTLMVLDTTIPLHLSAQVQHLPHQLAQADKLSGLVLVDAQLDRTLLVDNVKPLLSACQLKLL